MCESCQSKPTPHKHAEAIKAWADGAAIEYKVSSGTWFPVANPCWDWAAEYRVKAPLPTLRQIARKAWLDSQSTDPYGSNGWDKVGNAVADAIKSGEYS